MRPQPIHIVIVAAIVLILITGIVLAVVFGIRANRRSVRSPATASGATGSGTAPSRSVADELAKLAELERTGALSREEFEAQKRRLLS